MFTPTQYTVNQWRSVRPFGVRMPNRVTLEKSVDNRKSVLGKTITYLTRYGKATRLTIQKDALGFSGPDDRSKGWNSNLFRAMVNSGFIRKERNGRKVFYSLGAPADHVLM